MTNSGKIINTFDQCLAYSPIKMKTPRYYCRILMKILIKILLHKNTTT